MAGLNMADNAMHDAKDVGWAAPHCCVINVDADAAHAFNQLQKPRVSSGLS